ncbi:MAG: 2,3-bisphosphoglycerate-independent phosphoglycerate mutase [Actinomycetota bacterium]
MHDIVPRLAVDASTKIVLVVMDGLGGFRSDERGSELHAARTPNLDRLAAEGSSGLQHPVGPGITPGSGAGHLALFGYDPLVHELGRGALSAAGVGFELKPGDVAARVNFCTLDPAGLVVDRRAGRLSTEENERLCKLIRTSLDLGGRAEAFLVTERDHRALLVLRGEGGLSPRIADTDPQVAGVPPYEPRALAPEAEHTAALLKDLLEQVRGALHGEFANFILLRGFDTLRELPSFSARYRLRALGVAGYPMYVGIARLLGMDATEVGTQFDEVVASAENAWGRYDFFFLHHKATDSAGEDGDFDRKVAAIEGVDAQLSRIAALEPEVICVTGDHATPSQLRAHSWHPVPFVMRGPNVGIDAVSTFDEEAAMAGGLGSRLGKELIGLMLAAAGRLAKYGA